MFSSVSEMWSPDAAQACRFCKAAHPYAVDQPWHDEPIYTTTNFVAVPSLGALVEGWMLVLPREHLINSSHIPAALRNEFDYIVATVHDLVARTFGSPTVFEHGAATNGSQFGCGTDHAHLHVVPLPFDLKKATSDQVTDLQWVVLDHELTRLPHQPGDYLALANESHTLLALPGSPVSQFFRRIIAASLGRPNDYNYRSHLFLPNVVATRSRLLARLALGKTPAGITPSALLDEMVNA